MNFFYMSDFDHETAVNYMPGSEKMHMEAFTELERRKDKWNTFAKNAPTMLEYHLKHIYFNEKNKEEENVSSGPSFTYT
ncbi:MAG: hypothetical protein EBQ89_00315 [Alphaproteobacteria bacterium]|nr:hypothetical protein [Alphaproteobacteria bacterium]